MSGPQPDAPMPAAPASGSGSVWRIWLGIVLNVLAIVYLCHEFYLSWRNTRLEKQEELESR